MILFRRDLSHAWRALRHRNFRLFFGGQTISLIGNWMTRIATGWLVSRLTGSALLLGLVGFSGQILTFVFAPFAGVWVDRLNRQRVLVVTQALATLQSFALAALNLANVITIPEILALSAFQGLINAFDMPGRQSFMVQMVEDRQDLGNVIAINSSMVNMAQLVGPSLAGIVIAGFGEGSKWVSRCSRIGRCCELSKSWELASCPLSVENSPQALRVTLTVADYLLNGANWSLIENGSGR